MDTNICDISLALDSLKKINDDCLFQVTDLIKDSLVSKTAISYEHHKGRTFEIGLNLFTLISDQYRRENLHSDVLKEILDPNGQHKEGNKFLTLFLHYLQKHPKANCLNIKEFSQCLVERESTRIDIGIKDLKSKKAIIVENKINNAPDMQRQIPRYVYALEKQGYVVEAIVYLILNGNKQPDTGDWTEDERQIILDKVLPVCAFNETQNDLYNGWLVKCEAVAENIDAHLLFRHYNRLISKLGGNIMNQPLMEQFLKSMLEGNNYRVANGIKDMLDDLIKYRRDKIIEEFKFRSLPFTSVRDWNNYAVIDSYYSGNLNFAIDVIVEKNMYRIQFFERVFNNKNETVDEANPATLLLEEIGLLDRFFTNGRRMEIQFKFPEQESELYDFLQSFIAIVNKHSTKVA